MRPVAYAALARHARAGAAGGDAPRPTVGAPGARRPVLPRRRQRRLRRRQLRPRARLLAEETGSTGRGRDRRDRRRRPRSLQPRPAHADEARVGDASTAPPQRPSSTGAQELEITPAAQIAAGSAVHGRASHTAASRSRSRTRTAPPRAGSRPRTAPFAPNEPQGSPSWYPCNDHPVRQGAVLDLADRAEGAPGDLQRRAARQGDERAAADAGTGRQAAADGHLPGDRRDRQFRITRSDDGAGALALRGRPRRRCARRRARRQKPRSR